MEQRKNIALFIGMLETEFSRNICEGALLGAKEIDANLFVMPGGIIDADYTDKDFDTYRRRYNILYSYAELYPFDAIILEYGTITSLLNHERKQEFLKQLGDIPVILLAGNIEGYSSVCIDNRTGMKEAVAHLIEQHQCSKIGFVSGPKTNQDAIERLQAYRETMEEHGLPVSEEQILYADFSEYCSDAVEAFILRNPELEAIAFANDQMALSGYKAMERLHLIPGKDILVTGFDDSPLAMMLEPHLSSVKVDAKEMAYRAVVECCNVIEGQEIHQSVKSRLVVRESCGCKDEDVVEKAVEIMMREMREDLVQQLADDMFDKYYNVYFDNMDKFLIRKNVEEYFEYFFHMVRCDGSLKYDRMKFEEKYRMYMLTCQYGYVDLKEFLLMDQIIYGYLSKQIKDEKDKLCLIEHISALRRELISNITTQKIVAIEKSKIFEPILASLTSDMLYYSTDEKKGYETVIRKLQKLEFPSSCILIYDDGVQMSDDGHWDIPERFCVKAYHDGDEKQMYQGGEKEVSLTDMFTSSCMPMNRRFDMLVIPLFANTVQYGFLLIESEAEYFDYAIQIACQLSVSIEVIEILKKQNEIKRELELSLARIVENNRMLDQMSRLDPLTGILNRRGFLNYVKKIASDEMNYGKTAIAVYADMDNLKIINDEFGHDEGDYSLKLIAKALSESFRQSDVVARMGGDEFAAFAIVSQENFPEIIKTRIHSTLAEMNVDNGKPYYVNMSVGTAEFVIDEFSNVEHILTEADKDLYMEKKNKKKVVYKN